MEHMESLVMLLMEHIESLVMRLMEHTGDAEESGDAEAHGTHGESGDADLRLM